MLYRFEKEQQIFVVRGMGPSLPERGAGLAGSLWWDGKEDKLCVLYLVTIWTSSGVKLVFAWRMTTKMGLLSDKGKR